MSYQGTDQYVVVFSWQMGHFVQEVQGQIDKGYKPQGGMTIHRNDKGGIFYYQAMYKGDTSAKEVMTN